MWKPSERLLRRCHVAGSLAALVCGITVMAVCLAPAYVPGVYRVLADDRVAMVMPYLLFIVLGEAAFSVWYFLFRK